MRPLSQGRWLSISEKVDNGSHTCSLTNPTLQSALEFVTQGLARATSHRVLSPERGSTPRYSVPFFQNISQNIRLTDHILQCAHINIFYGLPICSHVPPVPPEVLELKERRGIVVSTDCELPTTLMHLLIPKNVCEQPSTITNTTTSLPAKSTSQVEPSKFCIITRELQVRYLIRHPRRSHPDVTQRHYPELFKELFPQGLPAYGSAY